MMILCLAGKILNQSPLVTKNKLQVACYQALMMKIQGIQLWQIVIRLGQLLINEMNFQQPCPELFHVEDNVLTEKLSQYSNIIKS